MKLAEIRQKGYQALTNALGVVGKLRFIQQLEFGYGNYTPERHQTPEPTLEEFQKSNKIGGHGNAVSLQTNTRTRQCRVPTGFT